MEVVVISLIMGAFISLTFWNIYRFFSVVPDEDRSYLDRPPTGFRVIWPLIQALVYYFGSVLNRDYRIRTHQRLRQAGVEFMLSPEQFFAGKMIAALFFAALAYLLTFSFRSGAWLFVLLAAFGGFLYPELWLSEVRRKRDSIIFRELPFYLDIIILAVEAGTNFTGGLTQAVQKAPDGPLRFEWSRVLRDIRAGKTRADALREMTERVSSDGIRNVTSSIIQAEKTGSSLGVVLRAQADNLRTMRFLQAEKMAMEAPVKLLGPLIMFIFPTTFLVISFVLLSEAISQGILGFQPLVWAYYFPSN